MGGGGGGGGRCGMVTRGVLCNMLSNVGLAKGTGLLEFQPGIDTTLVELMAAQEKDGGSSHHCSDCSYDS